MQSQDGPLAAQLEAYRSDAAFWLSQERAGNLEHRLTAKPDWSEMQQNIAKLIEADSEFGPAQRSVYFAGKQINFYAWVQSQNLLSAVAEDGVSEALAWYREALQTSTSDVLVIAEVHGLEVKSAVSLSNGVSLVPVSDLPDGPLSRALAAQSQFTLGASLINLRHPAAAVVKLEQVEAAEDHEASRALFNEAVARIRRSVVAFTIGQEHAPTVGVTWTHLEEPALARAEFGISAMTAQYDGRQETWPQPLTSDLIAKVEAILALEGKVASVCEVALSRINLAKRRLTPGDKAIEGCVALEALLGDSSPGDLTYKLSLRSALLLGGTLEERKATRKKVRDFYQLRSKVVHGHQGSGDKAPETAKAGLEICLEILGAVVSAGAIPDVVELELTGGAVGPGPG